MAGVTQRLMVAILPDRAALGDWYNVVNALARPYVAIALTLRAERITAPEP